MPEPRLGRLVALHHDGVAGADGAADGARLVRAGRLVVSGRRRGRGDGRRHGRRGGRLLVGCLRRDLVRCQRRQTRARLYPARSALLRLLLAQAVERQIAQVQMVEVLRENTRQDVHRFLLEPRGSEELVENINKDELTAHSLMSSSQTVREDSV